MPYTMVHLEVAGRLLRQLGWIERSGDFLLGAVAPDSVHFREHYEVSMKERSHLWTGCGPHWGMTTESEIWKQNVLTFWNQHKKDETRDFIAGYCAHILTDWWSNLRVWIPYRNEIEQIIRKKRLDDGEDINMNEIHAPYGQEAQEFDQWLYHTSDYSEEIWHLLMNGNAYSIRNCVRAEDIERQRRVILTEQFQTKESPDISGNRYCTKEVFCPFIEECVEIIVQEIIL